MKELKELDAENRRGAPRLARTLDVRYVHVGGCIQSARAINISQTGARLMLEGSAVGTELTVEFEGKLAVLARAVWQQMLPGGKQMVGIVFEGIHWGQRLALDDYLFDLERRAA